MDWKAPKSVRQIGDTKGKTKIYVEDYVMSFARRMSKERKGTELGGVLLGHRFYHAREKVFLISGMVSIKDFHKRESDTFSQEMWTGIYTDIKENFTDLDIVGWYYSGKGQSRTGFWKYTGGIFLREINFFIYMKKTDQEMIFTSMKTAIFAARRDITYIMKKILRCAII